MLKSLLLGVDHKSKPLTLLKQPLKMRFGGKSERDPFKMGFGVWRDAESLITPGWEVRDPFKMGFDERLE